MRRCSYLFAAAIIAGLLLEGRPGPARAETDVALPPALSVQIDRMARNELHAGRTPGLAIGVVESGRLVYAHGFGFANVAKHLRMAPDTEFYVGGLTTQFTAAAILLLVQDRKLGLDDRVAKYVPEFKLAADVTIGQLLSQTSGLPDPMHAPGISPDLTRSIKLSDLFAAVDKMKAAAPPGAIYANNPLNYLVAGLIVERASGVPLSDYLEQHIFVPLVMDHSFLAGDSGISPSHAIGYTRAGSLFVSAPMWDPTWLAGNSGMVSTIYDFAKWDIEMPILLRVDALRTMFTPSARSGPTRYGVGWVIDRRGGKDFIWANSEISGYRAMNALLPDQHVAVIIFSNADSLNGGPVTIPEELGARILDLLAPPATTQLDNTIVARAKEWLGRLASRNLDREDLTPAFSAYLTDELVARENLAALGPLQEIVPISSRTESNGDTLYEFLVHYQHAQYQYKFELTPSGKVNEIALTS